LYWFANILPAGDCQRDGYANEPLKASNQPTPVPALVVSSWLLTSQMRDNSRIRTHVRYRSYFLRTIPSTEVGRLSRSRRRIDEPAIARDGRSRSQRGRNFIERNRSWLNRLHLRVLTAIERCRTAALGGHLDECSRCGHRVISFNSCRNRHCPKCQANARDRWLTARQREPLPTRYVHVVFTLPHELAPLALQNKQAIYDLLFRISAETLLEVARDPQHLGADIGFFSVLHSWNQKLQQNPHS
jgi:hypothetical protein